VFAGAIANAAAVARAVAGAERVAVVCAGEGRGRRFALEDLVGAGVIVREMLAGAPEAVVGDGARLALLASEGDPGARLREAEHAKALVSLGFEADVAFCAKQDTSAAAPVVVACGEGWVRLEAAGVTG
jgi:2-phosphosulfolactate phosphatase